ncbi:hypothetical protein Emag_001507 [Eimeria magna]
MGKRLAFRLVVSAVASLLCMKACGATPDPNGSRPTQHSAGRIDCLEEMNGPRTAVGFPKFEDPTEKDKKLPVVEKKLQSVESVLGRQSSRLQKTRRAEASQDEITETEQSAFLISACQVIRGKTNEGLLAQVNEFKGIYMYASQDSDSGDCAAAVLFWKGAVEHFSELPPAYLEDITPYTNPQIISFVGLYNPGQSATVDCAVITCQPGAEVEEGGPDKNNTWSVLFLRQDQWNKIAGVQNNFAQPTMLAAMTLAVAALVHSVA